MSENQSFLSKVARVLVLPITAGFEALGYAVRPPTQKTVQAYDQSAARDERVNADIARGQATSEHIAAQNEAARIRDQVHPFEPLVLRGPPVLERRFERN